MAFVDELIDVIDNGDELTAQELLEQQPDTRHRRIAQRRCPPRCNATALGSPQEYDRLV